jgi:hypothetical protein
MNKWKKEHNYSGHYSATAGVTLSVMVVYPASSALTSTLTSFVDALRGIVSGSIISKLECAVINEAITSSPKSFLQKEQVELAYRNS